MSFQIDSSGIAGLVLVVALLIWWYRAGIRPGMFADSLPRIAKTNGWTVWSEEPSDEFVNTGLRGTHQGHSFELCQHIRKGRGEHVHRDSNGNTTMVRDSDHTWWTLSVLVAKPLPVATYELNKMHGVRARDQPVDPPLKLAQWWKDARGVTRQFTTGRARIRADLGSSISQGKFNRNLDFLVGVAQRL